MFLLENARRQAGSSSPAKHLHRPLQNDHSMIELLVDKVNRAAGNRDPILQRLALRIQTGKGGKQRRMNIENALRKGLDEPGREHPHVAGQADQVDFVRLEATRSISASCSARVRPRASITACSNPRAPRGRNSRGIRAVRHHDCDLGLRNLSGRNRAGDGEKVRSPAGKQNPQSMPGREQTELTSK